MELRDEVIQTRSDQSLHAFTRDADEWPFCWHRHPEYELTAICSGQGIRLVGELALPYQAPELVLLGPDLPHTWQSLGPGPHVAHVVQFHPRVLPSLGLDLPEAHAVRQCVERASAGLLCSDAGFLQHAFMQLRELVSTVGFKRVQLLQDLLYKISAADLSSLVPGRAQAVGPDPRLAELYAFIQAHLTGPLSLRDVADHMHMQSASCARFIRKQTGRTCMDIIHQLRINQACSALLSSGDSITTVAFAVGFNNLSHFNRVFKRQLGITPRMYRQRARANADEQH